MAPEEIERITKEIFETVREFSERNGVKAFMCAIVAHDIPPSPVKDSAGFTNMSSDELVIVGNKLGQVYYAVKKRETEQGENPLLMNINLN